MLLLYNRGIGLDNLRSHHCIVCGDRGGFCRAFGDGGGCGGGFLGDDDGARVGVVRREADGEAELFVDDCGEGEGSGWTVEVGGDKPVAAGTGDWAKGADGMAVGEGGKLREVFRFGGRGGEGGGGGCEEEQAEDGGKLGGAEEHFWFLGREECGILLEKE